ncbi:MAG: insulinase family protein [Candidatus Krumholzibacteria bacterium]|nr:insulinase family protein [Candidatus Krumholzibacteria bacterium]
MKRKILIPVLVTVLAVMLAAPLTAGRKHPSKLKYPDLEVKVPEVMDISFPNGMKGFMIEDHEIPTVNIVILFKTYFPEKEKFGLNELARWVMRNGGSESWPADKLNDELEFLPAQVEFFGGNLSTSVFVNCMKKDLENVLGILADVVTNPSFPEEKIQKKKDDMLEDIRRKNDQPGDIVNREFNKLLYGDHPYSWETGEASVSSVTRDDIVSFHDTWFVPNNAIIGISGDVTKPEIEKLISEAFTGWEQGEVNIPKVPETGGSPDPTVNYIYKDISQAYINLGHLGINSKNPDKCAVTIMNFILGGGSFTSWITTEVREKRGLAYSARSRYSSDPFAVGVFSAFAQTSAGEYSRALQVILDQIERMKTDGPTEEELRKAVDSFLNSQIFDYDSKAGMVRRLINLQFQGRPLNTPEEDMARYAALTVEDIKAAALKYLDMDKLTILVVGDKDQFDRPLSEFGEVNEIELK